MSNKIQWDKPQLTILARGTPEEAVLEHCKQISGEGGVTANLPTVVLQSACSRVDTTNCGACQSRSGS